MSRDQQELESLERRLRALLEADAGRLDGRTRSRLARARYAALEEAGRARRGFWRALAGSGRGFLPAGTIAAAVLVASLLMTNRQQPSVQTAADSRPAFDELEWLAADVETLELIEGWDVGFYEWAAAEGDATEYGG